jgi:succinylglutamate desuccinylase
MFEEIRQLGRGESGPVSIILAGVHGDERCGVDALFSVFADMRSEAVRGRVFSGFGNPQAIDSGKRFVETDLNRMFLRPALLSFSAKKSYEYGRAEFLRTYLDRADVLLDLHASCTEASEPFAICEANAKDVVSYLPVKWVVSGFDEVEPGGTDYYMNSIGKVGICVECGYNADSASVGVARNTIVSFLVSRGHIPGVVEVRSHTNIRMHHLYKTRTDHFVLEKPFADFEEIRGGEIIGTDGEKVIRAERDSVILFARNRIKIGEEAYLLGEIKNSLA